jgi:AraC family transcriptional regulator, transcriptional activator FtrA
MIATVRDRSAKRTDRHFNGPVQEGRRPDSTRSSDSTRWSGAVAAIVYDGIGLFELGVAFDTFGNHTVTDPVVPWYEFFVCGPTSTPFSANGGLQMQAPHGLERIRDAGTVVVLPTERLEAVPKEVFEALRQAHRRGSRIVSLCTGAFVLAEAGLLDGRRATTHWSECDELARRYPQVSVDPGVLYVDEGDILTSAGSAASIDLCLHVVRKDHGSEIATQVARDLVVPPQRDGGQAQYIDAPLPSVDDSNLFADTIAWLQGHLDETLTVNDLAARSAMSPRTFARRFLAATGTTPHKWLQRQRVQLAQRLLEASDLSIEAVAQRSGFSTGANLRKHFSRIIYTSPQAYRHTFQDRTTRSEAPPGDEGPGQQDNT